MLSYVVEKCIIVGAKEFLEAGKQRFFGNTQRQATSDEVGDLRKENNQLHHLIADSVLKNTVLKKCAGFGLDLGRKLSLSASEKIEVIRMVDDSELSIRRIFAELGISRSSFYRWYQRYQLGGPDALESVSRSPRRFWKKLPESVKEQRRNDSLNFRIKLSHMF